MLAADTNVLVRLVLRDDIAQAQRAAAFVARGVWVSTLVLAETIWVLGVIYHQPDHLLQVTVEDFLHHDSVVLQDREAVEIALGMYRENAKLGFSDCLVVALAHKNGHTPIGTFDKALAKIEGVQKL